MTVLALSTGMDGSIGEMEQKTAGKMPALPNRRYRGSWREGQAFIAGDDPDADDAGFLALLFLSGVVGIGHRVEGAESYRHLDRV